MVTLIAVTRSRFFSFRPISHKAVVVSRPGSPLNLAIAKTRLAERQFAIAAASSCCGEGPAPSPSGAGSSVTAFSMPGPKSTRNRYLSWRVMVTETCSLIVTFPAFPRADRHDPDSVLVEFLHDDVVGHMVPILSSSCNASRASVRIAIAETRRRASCAGWVRGRRYTTNDYCRNRMNQHSV